VRCFLCSPVLDWGYLACDCVSAGAALLWSCAVLLWSGCGLVVVLGWWLMPWWRLVGCGVLVPGLVCWSGLSSSSSLPRSNVRLYSALYYSGGARVCGVLSVCRLGGVSWPLLLLLNSLYYLVTPLSLFLCLHMLILGSSIQPYHSVFCRPPYSFLSGCFLIAPLLLRFDSAYPNEKKEKKKSPLLLFLDIPRILVQPSVLWPL